MRTSADATHTYLHTAQNRRSRTRPITAEKRLHNIPQYLCAGAFLMGYLPGILAARKSPADFGQSLADFYINKNLSFGFADMFLSQAASAFLQIQLICFLGFTVFGFGFLPLVFLAKGCFIGFCSSEIVSAGGVQALYLYWFSDCLPGVFILFIQMWLANYAVLLSRNLFQDVFLGGAPRGQLTRNARRLIARFIFSLPLSCLICMVGSALVLLITDILHG